MSRWLRITGLFLWIIAAAAAYAFWRSERAPVAKPVDPANGTQTADDSIFKPIPEVAPSEGAEATQPKLDKEGLPLPAWDPNGLPDFEFTERSGKKITKADLLGKPWAVCFVFTRCAGPCPRVTGQLRLLQDRLKDVDARLVTVTVDPEFDTPEQLAKYARQFGADPEKWLFLSGDKNKTYRLIIDGFHMPVQEFFGEDRKPGYEVLHTTNVMLVDAKGRVVNKYNAQFDEEMSELAKALKHEAELAKK